MVLSLYLKFAWFISFIKINAETARYNENQIIC